MLTGLRHDTFIGSNDQDGSINATNACQHILNKIPMTRHIDNPNLAGFWEIHPAKTEVNRHLAFLLFLKTIRVGTGESSHESGFSMVHMTGCTNYAHATSFMKCVLPGNP